MNSMTKQAGSLKHDAERLHAIVDDLQMMHYASAEMNPLDPITRAEAISVFENAETGGRIEGPYLELPQVQHNEGEVVIPGTLKMSGQIFKEYI